jgi:hypothetical protein
MTAPIVKLSQPAAASALTGAEAIPVVQGVVTKRTHLLDLPIAIVLLPVTTAPFL